MSQDPVPDYPDPVPDFFVTLADTRKCRSSQASSAVRKHAIKKSGDYHNQHHENLLPTIETLRKPERNETDTASQTESILGAFTVGRIFKLLRCKCEGVCETQTVRTSDRDDTTLAYEIYNNDDQLRLFTVLCLSGCLFAARTLIRDKFSDPEQDVLHQDRHELRFALFRPFQSKLGPCIHTPRHTDKNRLMCLAKIFSDCLSRRSWIVRIPLFGRREQLLSFSKRCNMPFMEESESQSARERRRFFKFKVAPNYCSGNSGDLEGILLFRKELEFNHQQRAMQLEAEEESSVLSFINNMKHDHIVELVCAYKELRSDLHYVNLVFPWYEYDLESILKGRVHPENLDELLSYDPSGTMLESRFWKGMLGVMDAVKTIHSPYNENVKLDRGEVFIGGHFDIKPANILMNAKGRIVLADFGLAHLRQHRIGQSSTLPVRPGTRDYEPPQSSNGFSNKRSYDVWSVACVMLEVLTFLLLGGAPSVDQFYSDRLSEDNQSNRCAAFWIRGTDGKITLRKAVRTRLKELDEMSAAGTTSMRHPLRSLQPIIKELQAMFAIEGGSRPNMESALQTFKAEGALDFSIFIGQTEKEVMKRKLKEMSTDFTTERLSTPSSCNLFLWRDIVRGGDDERIKIVLAGTLAGSYGENTITRFDSFIPLSLFDPPAHFTTTYQTDNMLRCSFAKMHRATTLHFHRAKEYFDFQAMLTYQNLHTTKDFPLSRIITLNFVSLTLQVHSRMSSKDVTVTGGMVQIWRTLKESQYQQKFEKETESLHTPQHSSGSSFVNSSPVSQEAVNRIPTSNTLSPPHRRSSSDPSAFRFKLALFTFDPHKRACIIMDLIKNNYTCVDPPSNASTRIAFRRDRNYDSFPVAMFGWRAGESSTSELNSVAGIPLSPQVIENEILNGIKIRSLELDMGNEEARKNFKGLFDSIWRS